MTENERKSNALAIAFQLKAEEILHNFREAERSREILAARLYRIVEYARIHDSIGQVETAMIEALAAGALPDLDPPLIDPLGQDDEVDS